MDFFCIDKNILERINIFYWVKNPNTEGVKLFISQTMAVSPLLFPGQMVDAYNIY